MNILVTGAAGFIASHLIEELLKDSDNIVYGVDNFYSSTRDNIRYLTSTDKEKKFAFEELDIRDFDAVSNIIKRHKIKYIYHLAAIVSVQESMQNPLFSHEVNVKGTLNVLEAARLNNVKRIVFSSSAAVYGDEPSLPKNENSPLKPISPYGYEKLICEQYMSLYNNLYGLETVSLRYFNVYGERQNATSDYSGVISIFEKKIKNDEVPNIYGDGEQYRDFIYVKDVVKINIQVMNTADIKQDTFCVGTAKKTSINEVLNILSAKYDKKIKPYYLKARSGDIDKSVCDNTKVKKKLNINNFTTFKKGALKI